MDLLKNWLGSSPEDWLMDLVAVAAILLLLTGLRACYPLLPMHAHTPSRPCRAASRPLLLEAAAVKTR